MKLGGVFVEHLGKLALRLGHNLVFFAALWLAGAVLGLVLPWFLPVICATLGWLALSAYFFTKYEPWFDGWALLLGAVPIVMTAMSAADFEAGLFARFGIIQEGARQGKRGTDQGFHGVFLSQARPAAASNRSISLMPMNGAIRPPSP